LFNVHDERMVELLASHVATFIRVVYGRDWWLLQPFLFHMNIILEYLHVYEPGLNKIVS
jgi:hypothetical protein